MAVNNQKMLPLLAVSIILGGLSGCQVPEIAPVEQVQIANRTKLDEQDVTINRSIANKKTEFTFLCSQAKRVKVQYNYGSPNKISNVVVTWGDTSHALSPAVSKNGQKYSNIRWIWLEKFNGTATLFNNRNKLLATDCVKQQGNK